MKMLRTASLLVFSFLFVFLGMGTVTGAEYQKLKDLEIGEFFNGKEGTMVLKNLQNDQVYVYNKERSMERFTPESTFKVPNALIGLETLAVRDEYEVKRWDGVTRQFADWNRDHTLASGMRYSVIWYYQDMARDIGEEQMQSHVDLIQYGNQDISGGIDSFWLDSSMEISALEQADFIEKLVEEELPFEERHQKTVKRMMIQDEQDEYTLYGKTGTRLSDFGLGWFVGFIETGNTTWVYAVNIDGSGTQAKNITLETLKKKNIID